MLDRLYISLTSCHHSRSGLCVLLHLNLSTFMH